MWEIVITWQSFLRGTTSLSVTNLAKFLFFFFILSIFFPLSHARFPQAKHSWAVKIENFFLSIYQHKCQERAFYSQTYTTLKLRWDWHKRRRRGHRKDIVDNWKGGNWMINTSDVHYRLDYYYDYILIFITSPWCWNHGQKLALFTRKEKIGKCPFICSSLSNKVAHFSLFMTD